jgi:hypothetical protein
MSKTIRVIGSTNQMQNLSTEGIRLNGQVLTPAQSRRLVKTALGDLPPFHKKELEAFMLAGLTNEFPSLSAQKAFREAVSHIVTNPASWTCILA